MEKVFFWKILSVLGVAIIFLTLAWNNTDVSATTPNQATPSAQPYITVENADQLQQIEMIGQGLVTDFAWSPITDTIAVASTTGIWLYDYDEPSQSPLFLPSRSHVLAVSFNDDGSLLASGNVSGRIQVYEASTQREIASIHADSLGIVSSIDLSPNGENIVSVGSMSFGYTGVHLWDIHSQEVSSFLEDTSVRRAAFSSDGSLLVITGLSHLYLWDIENGLEIMTIENVEAYALSPSRQTVAYVNTLDSEALESNTCLQLLTLDDLQANNVLWCTDDRVDSLTLSQDGAMVAVASQRGSIRVIDTETGETISTFSNGYSLFEEISFSPDNSMLATRSFNDSIVVWDVMGAEQLALLNYPGVSHVGFTYEGRWLAGESRDGSIRLWNTATFDDILLHAGSNYDLIKSTDATMTALSRWNDSSPVWELLSVDATTIVGSVPIYGRNVLAVASDQDEAIMVVGNWGYYEPWYFDPIEVWKWPAEIHIVNVQTNETVGVLPYSTARVSNLSLTPDAKQVVFEYDGEIKVWDIATNMEIAAIQQPDNLHILFVGEGISILTDETGNILLWAFDLDHISIVAEVVSSPKGAVLDAENARLALGLENGMIEIWNLQTQRKIMELQHDDCPLPWYSVQLAFNPNREILASSSDNQSICLWDTNNGTMLTTLVGHAGAVTDLLFTSDGGMIVSDSSDHTIRRWGVIRR